jgi:argininosuccinate lyase
MSNKMWGGRFTERPDAIMEEINVSIDVDRHLYAQDIAASKAHAAMLAAQGIITRTMRKISQGSRHDFVRNRQGIVRFQARARGHSHECREQARRVDRARRGPAAHRAFRNDQVATDFRLYVRDMIDETDAALASFQRALVEAGDRTCRYRDAGFYTSADRATGDVRASSVGLCRNGGARPRRFADARKRLNESPLGAAALAGTSFPIDRDATAKTLGFERPMANSLDAVSDRDFVLETCRRRRSPPCTCRASPRRS